MFPVEILETQEQYAKDVLLYLQILDPGKTWRKSQIVSRLRAITTALAKVSQSSITLCLKIHFSIFLLSGYSLSSLTLQKKADKQEIDTATLKSSLRTIQDLSQAIHKLW